MSGFITTRDQRDSTPETQFILRAGFCCVVLSPRLNKSINAQCRKRSRDNQTARLIVSTPRVTEAPSKVQVKIGGPRQSLIWSRRSFRGPSLNRLSDLGATASLSPKRRHSRNRPKSLAWARTGPVVPKRGLFCPVPASLSSNLN